jgi:hypothetical protein
VQLCYVDESGKAETLTRADFEQQPVVVIAGISLPEERLTAITHQWIELKRKYPPGMVRYRNTHGWLDGILREIKGTAVRRGFRTTATNRQRKHAIGLIDGVMRLLEEHDARIIGRMGASSCLTQIRGMNMHVSSLQFICGAFQRRDPRRRARDGRGRQPDVPAQPINSRTRCSPSAS